MKKWVDANNIIKMVTDLEDHRLRELDKEMREKPNFNKADEKPKKNNRNRRTRTWRNL
ncbi:MAG: hypothetical protein ACRCX2_33800 [Paraclostridium sp.]